MSKIAVIGAGSVGATTAYTLVMKNLAAEVILVDINEAKEEGEVMDIN
ncbi:MAG: L-lactate dehydrogenase, partial [Candidatus Yanofskybacteria bacterium GW2011_GWF2_43_596]